jgi:dihydrofolate reductase
MTKVYTGASMSLDGYIAGPNETGFDQLFKWMSNGDVALPTSKPEMTFQLTEVSAQHVRGMIETAGALVVGRRLFDLTNGWGGNHPMGVPVVVLTHSVPDGWPREGAPFTFVTEGIEQAIETAKAIAKDRGEDKAVGVNGGTMARQALDAGLIDEIWVELVPVLLGGGTPFLDQLQHVPVELDDPTIQQGTGVTHLRYRVRR